jgi:hypothetical protein
MADVRIKDLPSRALVSGDALELDDGATAGGNRFEPSADVVTLLNAANAAGARAAIGTDAAGVARPPTAHGHTASEISDSTATGRSLIQATDAAAARTAINAETAGAAATAEANAIAASCQRASNLSDVSNVVTARENLGLRNSGQKRDLLRGFSFVEHFASGTLSPGLAIMANGTGAAAISGSAAAGTWGTLGLSTGTTTTGRCGVHSTAASTTLSSTLYAGAGAISMGAKLNVSTLSDGTETFTVRCGGVGDANSADSTDGIYFRYTHTENGGDWTCVTRANSVETATDSTIAVVAGTNYWLECVVNAAGTQVEFYINGVLRATHNTNVPTGTTRSFGLLPASIVKSAGTTARSVEIDDYYFDLTFTTPRT